MSEMKFYWDNKRLEHSESIFFRSTNLQEENTKKIITLKSSLNVIFNNVGLDQRNSEILTYKTHEGDHFGFATPFLNIINISETTLQNLNQKDLLWLVTHEQIHILEAEIISNIKIYNNKHINWFKEIIRNWLTGKFDKEIFIKSNVFDIINSYVYNYKDLSVDWENTINFEMKYGDPNYRHEDLLETYANIIPQNEKICEVPNNDKGLRFLQGAFIEFLNHWSKELGDGNLESNKGKIITTFLINWTLHLLFTEITRSNNDYYSILSEARAIYFSAILLNRDIDEYEDVFSKADARLFEANRLKTKYGEDFKFENLIMSIKNEKLSSEGRKIAINSFFPS